MAIKQLRILNYIYVQVAIYILTIKYLLKIYPNLLRNKKKDINGKDKLRNMPCPI